MFQLRAKSSLENSIFQISSFEPPDSNLIFIDIETDIACERVWLIGLLVDNQFIQLYADNWDEEKAILLRFLEILKDHSEYKLVSYSCTNFDYRVLLAALNRYSLDASVLESYEHTDLGIEMRNCFVFPNQSYALKNLGAFMKYPFKYPEIDGLVVALKYMSHVEDGKPLDKTLLEYNEDDVRVIPYLISELKSRELKNDYSFLSANKDVFSSNRT
jgi:predicted RecB family nuclease